MRDRLYNFLRTAPFVVPAAFVGFGVPAMALLLLGAFKTWLVLLLGLAGAALASVVAARHSAGLKLPGSAREQRLVGLVVLLFLLAWTGINFRYSAQDIIVTRDPAIYSVTGEWLKNHDNLDIRASAPLVHDPGVTADSAGFASLPGHPDRLYAQGVHLLPALLGMAGRLGGTAFMLHINAVIGGLALLAFYGLAACFVRPRWALFAVVALGLSLPMIFFSRDTYSEPLGLLLTMGALALVWAAQTRSSSRIWLLAGLAAGAGTLARADAYLIVAALTAFAMTRLCFAAAKQRGRIIKESLWFALGMAATTLLGWLDLTMLSTNYYHDLRRQIIKELLLIVLIIAAGIAVTAVSWRTDLLKKLIRGTRKWYKPLIIAAAVLLSIFFLSRPLWYEGHVVVPNGLIASLQAAKGHAVEPTRSYAEMSAYWVIWYIGPVLALAALIGLTMSALDLTGKRPRQTLLPPVLVVAGIAFVYLLSPDVSPDQVWASRRFLPVVFPGFCLFAVIATEHYWRRYLGSYKAAIQLTAAALLMLVVLLQSFYYIKPSLRVKAYASEVEHINKVCAALPDHAAVFLTGSEAFNMGQTIRTFCKVPAVRILYADATSFRMEARTAANNKLTPIVVTATGADGNASSILAGQLHMTLVDRAEYQELSRRLYHPPRQMAHLAQTVLAGRLQPDGSVTPL